jgi:hypothetical protein
MEEKRNAYKGEMESVGLRICSEDLAVDDST